MSYTFDPATPSVVPTTEGQLFPVRRIFCVGKNYADHVREMGGDPSNSSPVYFTKPADAVICPDAANPHVPYAPHTKNLHYEGELVVALKSGGVNINPGEALSHIYGHALGSDMTRRDLQHVAKDNGAPWDMAKGFDASAVMGPIRPGANLNASAALQLLVNGEVRQNATLAQMIFDIPTIIADLSTYITLAAGDLIYTGTPEGVGAVKPGDRIEVTCSDLPRLEFIIA